MGKVWRQESFCADDTYAFGGMFAKEAKPGDVFCLYGDLGCGKTVFAQGFGAGLGVTEPIASPTFTILKQYDEGRLPFYHFDVYRIADPNEMDEIGYYEAVDGSGVCLIEWAELIEDILPLHYKKVTITKDSEQGFDYRVVKVEDISR